MTHRRHRTTKIYVDLDDTLIRTVYIDKSELDIPAGFVEVTGMPAPSMHPRSTLSKSVRAVCVRPTARGFLEDLWEHGEVNILTTGHSVLQTRKLEVLGLRDLVKNVYGKDNVKGAIVLPKYWLLIDDIQSVPIAVAETNKWNWLTGGYHWPTSSELERH